MIPNLLHYSNHSQKISPAELEMNKTPSAIKNWKILVAFFMDFYLVAMATNFMSIFFKAAVGSYMPTSKMSFSLLMINTDSLSLSIVPLTLVSYFFISFFMNDGQSYGMKKMKLRFENTSYDEKSALLWAARSASVILSLGVSMYFLKDLFKQKCVTHDHLYSYLMIQREWEAPSLVERTTLEENHYAVEEVSRAA